MNKKEAAVPPAACPISVYSSIFAMFNARILGVFLY